MSYPIVYDQDYSYTGFSVSLGDGSFPGSHLDNDLAGIIASLEGISAFLEGTIRSDGIVKLEMLPGGFEIDAAVTEATTQAATATAQAAIATTQAGIATTKATEADASADAAAADAAAVAAQFAINTFQTLISVETSDVALTPRIAITNHALDGGATGYIGDFSFRGPDANGDPLYYAGVYAAVTENTLDGEYAYGMLDVRLDGTVEDRLEWGVGGVYAYGPHLVHMVNNNLRAPAGSRYIISNNGWGFLADCYGGYGGFTGRRSAGNATTPAALIGVNTLTAVAAAGWHDGGAFGNDVAVMRMSSAGDFTATSQPTRIDFETTPSGAVAPVARLRVQPTGVVDVLSGQLGFPATQAPSASPNVLDDYEEGVFTPTIIGTGTAGTGTYSVQAGRYTKIGDRVMFELEIVWSAHTGTTSMKVSGLPFANGARKSAVALSYSALTFAAALHGYVETSASTIVLFTSATGAAEAALPIDVAATLRVSGSYSVS